MKDPYELTPLTDRTEVKARLSAELDRWLKSQGDPGIPQDTQEALQAARKGKPLYGPTGSD